ncbi:polysaccharide pyruvyl transferase CsaB [Oceanobacillus bengalensis]|uniref:Polysaccharide pyruvyl transferase CsaB n=1 Tax=Oceanobacillus bengalensis TaxID=1435466 RepID=A0A494YZU0_9BACI|nr:polysaccharide pyruvyl transferase CsaB [Oceanobacillus bengalensis]RKQ15739.1 polysaccharide pyruvyl transferase CsaB [Oceanobacillus bengalensis]
MHVVLSGYYGFDNVGDEAILYSMILAIRKVQPETKITVLSQDPLLTERLYDVHAVKRSNFREVSRVIKASDGLISGGGSLMQDQTSMKSIPYYCGIIQLAKWHKKPVFIYAQGVGPVNQKLGKWIIRHTFNKTNSITVRDPASQNLLEEIGVVKQIELMPDPVLSIRLEQLQRNERERTIAVSVREWPTEVKYKEMMANSLDSLVQYGYEVIFVPMHGKQDKETSLEIARHMTEESSIFSPDSSLEEKIAIISEANLLIGMRLHSLIFAAIGNTPFLAISYDPKIDAFMEMFQQPVTGHVEKEDWDEMTLLDHAKHLLLDETNERRRLETMVGNYRRLALQTAEMALQTFSEKRKVKSWQIKRYS